MAQTTYIAGASVWEQELYDYVCNHGAREGAMLAEYQRIADDESTSPAFRYLATMILEDERRHHALFDDLANTIRQTAEFRDEELSIPSLAGLRRDRERIIDITERLLKSERDDSRTLDVLRKQLKDVRDTTLWDLIVEVMQHDTDKHIKILRFIRDHARDAVF